MDPAEKTVDATAEQKAVELAADEGSDGQSPPESTETEPSAPKSIENGPETGPNAVESDSQEQEHEQQASAVGQQEMTSIPPELLVKHPLQCRWVLWYCKAERGKNWEDCLKQVATFDTVEDFWALYNHIQLASGLPWGSDYYLFKEGIKPMWEDPQNVKGGRWLIMVERNRRSEVLDHYWLELLMAMIGEQFEDMGDQICGCVANVRQKGDKVSLWTHDKEDEGKNKRIGQILKKKLNIEELVRYEIHADSKEKNSSMVKPTLVV